MMELKNLVGKFFSARTAPARFVMPSSVFEVQSRFVAGARLEKVSGEIRHVSVRELEPGCVIPTTHRPNLAKPKELEAAIRAVAGDLGAVPGPLGVLLPDGAVRVSLLSFETLPSDLREQEGLIRWKLRDVLPFAPDEARMTYEVLPAADGKGVDVVAMVSRELVVREYESAFEPLGGAVRLLLPASAMLLPLLPKEAEGGDLLLHIYGTSLVAAVVAGGRLRLWRYQGMENGAEEVPDETVSREAARVIASAADHWGIEITRAWLCTRPPATRELQPRLASAIALDVQTLEYAPGAATHLSPEEKVFLDRYGIPFAGLAAQGRV
jgi:hypothetical protein